MDEFTTRTYGTSGLDNRPLFGETSARDRIINLVVGGFTLVFVLETVVSSVVFPSLPPQPLNIFFAVCILLACGSTIVLVTAFTGVILSCGSAVVLATAFIQCCSPPLQIFWYRQGDLEPKFRNLIYYMLASIVLLCLCANLYFHNVR
ncbi:unnamed protein product, partial [Tetraodon nigroviridis]